MGLCISEHRPGDEDDPRSPSYIEPDDDDPLIAIDHAIAWLNLARREFTMRGGMNSTCAGLIEDAVREIGGCMPVDRGTSK